MALHALEFVLAPADDAAVRADWASLSAAGLPSRGDHRGATNAPHVTLASASASLADHLPTVRSIVAGLLPLRVPLAGLVVLGGRRRTLAWLLAADAQSASAVERCRRLVEDPLGPAWVPHLSVSGALQADQLGPAVAALPAPAGRTVTLTGLRHWDPDAGQVTPVLEG